MGVTVQPDPVKVLGKQATSEGCIYMLKDGFLVFVQNCHVMYCHCHV